MNEALLAWVNQTATNPAILACGVRAPDRTTYVKSFRQEITEAKLNQAIREVSEAVFALQQSRLVPERLRWSFEGGQIHSQTAPGNALVMLVVNANSLSSTEIQRLLAGCPLGQS